MPLGNALNPQVRGVRTFHPAPTPNWAFAAGTRGFTAMPFKGFLGPSSDPADLTRILHRHFAFLLYHIMCEYAREYANFTVYSHFHPISAGMEAAWILIGRIPTK